MKSFNVIRQDFNSKEFEPYDVMPYLINMYHESKTKPKNVKEFKEFIEKESRYMYWCRSEYEIVIVGWIDPSVKEKWDIHKQIMMNLDIITEVLMHNVTQEKPKKKVK